MESKSSTVDEGGLRAHFARDLRRWGENRIPLDRNIQRDSAHSRVIMSHHGSCGLYLLGILYRSYASIISLTI